LFFIYFKHNGIVYKQNIAGRSLTIFENAIENSPKISLVRGKIKLAYIYVNKNVDAPIYTTFKTDAVVLQISMIVKLTVRYNKN
jgi:hypothetical protein